MAVKRRTNQAERSITRQLIFAVSGLVILTALCIGGLAIYNLKQSFEDSKRIYEESMDQGYRNEIKSQIQSSIAILQSYYDMAQSGELSEEEAKRLAVEAIRDMRYREDGSGYMWIDDTDYNLVMHPILPDQEGNNRYDLTDQNGVTIIQNIMKTADAGGGFNEFEFTKADGVTVAPKLAYSEKFEPWGWVVTTGNYVDDMNNEIANVEKGMSESFYRMITVIVVTILIILFIAIFTAWKVGGHIAGGIRSVEVDLKKVADGDLSFSVNTNLMQRRDEVGNIARSLEQVRASLAEIIGNVSSSGAQLNRSSQHFSQKFGDIHESILNTNSSLEELAQGAAAQASETEVVNNKIHELGNVINIEKEEMGKLETSVSSMVNYSSGASNSIETLYEIANVTSNAVGIVSEQTEKTNESAESINKAVELIKGIAEQTNLLSLNASIEAARAGEAGRGFAVVAEEIRGLAEESGNSAAEIEDIVQELTRNIAISTNTMHEVTENVRRQQNQLEETRQAFNNLHEEIQIVGDVAREIGAQTDILDRLKVTVAESVNSLVSVVEQSAASTEETSASMQVLSSALDECTQDTQALVDLSKQQNEETVKFKL